MLAQEIQETEETEDAEECRTDPSDGNLYTFAQVSQFYRSQYDPKQIKQYWEEGMQPLRFQQADRVLCNLGERWIAGRILSLGVPDPDNPADKLPYVVKTDMLPGIGQKTISVPCDSHEVCCRERCFHEETELDFAKWAAPCISEKGRRKPLRFSLNEKVAIRVQDTKDGYEHWIQGNVADVWHTLPGHCEKEGFLTTADAIPYKIVVADNATFFCHLDEHTLIRRPENVPRTPGRTISKRFERRRLPDGSMEQFDHVALRSKILSQENANL